MNLAIKLKNTFPLFVNKAARNYHGVKCFKNT